MDGHTTSDAFLLGGNTATSQYPHSLDNIPHTTSRIQHHSHNISHNNLSHTTAHTQHPTHNVSHTTSLAQHLSQQHLTHNITHTTSHTQRLAYNITHTTSLTTTSHTQHHSHNIPHTTSLTQHLQHARCLPRGRMPRPRMYVLASSGVGWAPAQISWQAQHFAACQGVGCTPWRRLASAGHRRRFRGRRSTLLLNCNPMI